MNNWFECKIKYTKMDEASGKEKQVKEPYLIDAVSFTEAESRMHKLMEDTLGDEFIVSDLKKVNYSDIFNYDDSEQWYKVRVVFIDVDEKSGREKRVNHQMLVAARTVKEAHERIEENLQEVLIPYEITSIALSPILDVFPYFSQEEELSGESQPASGAVSSQENSADSGQETSDADGEGRPA